MDGTGTQLPPPPPAPVSAPPAALPAEGPARARLPEWKIEKVFATLNVVPAYLKSALDEAAAVPGLGRVVRFFSSVWLGILWLLLTGAYVAVGSGFSNLRAAWEMTDLQFFDAWPMQLLMILLCLTLTVVTLRRIPLTVFKAGVWTVHLGILTLVAGCFIYFGNKVEGSFLVFVGQTVDHFYDSTQRSLYVHRPDAREYLNAGLPQLPIFHEHTAANPLNIPISLAPLAETDAGLKDINVRVTGYYPFADLFNHWEIAPPDQATPGANPAVVMKSVLKGAETEPYWLIGKSPADRVSPDGLPFSVEYLYHPPAGRINEIATSFDGQNALTVRVPKLHFEKTYVVAPGQEIMVEGTPYKLKAREQTEMPLVSKGYEGARSTMYTFDVTRDDGGGKTFNYQRMAMFRYPERSPDFITQDGKPKRVQDGVDPDLQLVYHDATRDQFWVVEHDDGSFELIHRAAGGRVDRQALAVGRPADVVVQKFAFQILLFQATQQAVVATEPVVIPPEKRDSEEQNHVDGMIHAVVELEVRRGGWKKEHVYVPFVQFDDERSVLPTQVVVPGAGPLWFSFSMTERPLPTQITLDDTERVMYPGALSATKDFISVMHATDPGTGQSRRLETHLNNPSEDQGLYYFQVKFQEDQKLGKASVLGVGNRPGIDVMLAGAGMIVAGIGYAFYVKPFLLRAKKKTLAEAAGKA